MPNKKSFKIAVASGKGGTGKTFISTNLFNTLQQELHRVNLVDCDAEEPNDTTFIAGEKIKDIEISQLIPEINLGNCTYCGKCVEYCNYHAIFFLKEEKIIRVMEDLCHGCGACSVACTDGAITEKPDLLGIVSEYQVTEKAFLMEARMKVGVHSPVPVIKAAIKQAEDADLVIMDAPPGTSCPFIQTVDRADYVVLVTEPTPFGLSDLKQSVETLQSLHKPCGVIINKAGLGNSAVYDYLQKENIPLLMSVPFDKKIAWQYSTGHLLTNDDQAWKRQFSDLYNEILAQYGNSGN